MRAFSEKPSKKQNSRKFLNFEIKFKMDINWPFKMVKTSLKIGLKWALKGCKNGDFYVMFSSESLSLETQEMLGVTGNGVFVKVEPQMAINQPKSSYKHTVKGTEI